MAIVTWYIVDRERAEKMRESVIETYLREGVKKLGGRAYKWTSPGNDGVPDRIVVLPDRPPIFVELKTEKGMLSPLQKVQIARLRELGQDVRVLYGKEQVKGFLAECERVLQNGQRANSEI